MSEDQFKFRSVMRMVTDNAVTTLATLATVIVVTPLVAIFGYLVYKGASSLNLAFFTQIPKPEGVPGGGMANAIVGSGILLALASAIGVPIGIGGGIFLAEFGRGTKLANGVRFTADVLNGVPSIVMGLAAYALIVFPRGTIFPFLGHFSAFSGGVALGIMMIPTVCRTTEEMLLMVPYAVREAALGLGVPNWRIGAVDYREDGVAGHHHRVHAGLCPRCGRDGAAAVYGAGQFVHEHEPEPADRSSPPANLYVCVGSLRRPAPVGVGGITRADCVDCAGGVTGALRDQPWRAERGKLSGRRH